MMLVLTLLAVTWCTIGAELTTALQRRAVPLEHECGRRGYWIGRFCASADGNQHKWVDLCWRHPLWNTWGPWSIPPPRTWQNALAHGLDLEDQIQPLHFVYELLNPERIPKYHGFSYMQRTWCPLDFQCMQVMDRDADAHIVCTQLVKEKRPKKRFRYRMPGSGPNAFEGYIWITHNEFKALYPPGKNWPGEGADSQSGNGKQARLSEVVVIDKDITDVSLTAVLRDADGALLKHADTSLSAVLSQQGSIAPVSVCGNADDIGAVCEPTRQLDLEAGDQITFHFNLFPTSTEADDSALLASLSYAFLTTDTKA